jgi:tricorn protease
VRDFYANVDREGLIIDVRRNRGGNIDSWIIEKLLRRAWAYWQTARHESRRYGTCSRASAASSRYWPTSSPIPTARPSPPGSRRLELAPVIGTRTSGAGIWLSDRNRLADGGSRTRREFGQFDAAGTLADRRPAASRPTSKSTICRYATAQGGDAQLDAAIANVLQRLREAPLPALKAQPLPARGTPGHDGTP